MSTRNTFVPLLLLTTIHACQVCIPLPKKSVADHLLAADTVALARENPDRPFSFLVTETLKGTVEDPEVDLFLDSTTRRVLAAYPDRAVLLIRDSGNRWTRLGGTDPALQEIAKQVLELSEAWRADESARWEFFAARMIDTSRAVRELAQLEVAKAPYDRIKSLEIELSREEIRAYLADVRWIEWHSFYILLLAFQASAEDREYIHQSLRSAARFGQSKQLAAWATAAIECEGAPAVELLETEYFASNGRSSEELTAVATAMSVHGTRGRTHLRDRIVASYTVLLAHHPAMTPHLAEDLIAWERTELAEEIAAYVNEHRASLDPLAARRLAAYVRNATR